MDRRIQELIEFTKIKFGLSNYYLQRHRLYRNVNIFNETSYTLSMEWFPKHETVHEDDDSNPEGTASIEINVNTRKFESAIFVLGKTYAKDGITFANLDTKAIIKWIEQETGLKYGKQFQLHKEEEGELQFIGCYNGVPFSPSGSIEVKFDLEGKLTSFSAYGQFPVREWIREENYSLSLGKIEHIARGQLKLLHFPSFEQERLIPIYALEEIYVENDGASTIPFEIIADVNSYLKINKTIHWDEPLDRPFDRKEIKWMKDISEDQAFSLEPSPDSSPITKAEQEKCISEVKDFLRQEYPNDTGKWMLKTLHREKGYIHAILRANKQSQHVFQRKLMIIIDAKTLRAVNYMDNKPMLEMYDQFQAPGPIMISKEEAYEKLNDQFELNPYYVYDFDRKQYVLCGKFDCQFGVNASTGEVVALKDL
ncbi:hypothetical protein [Neobacillus niacini]|uniref:hypothetical protein n=1 Tax=Neobacillus niacini TaxID=86668 RepID=UPI0021CB60E6|nr:hypothetical protein [Neobacillus niacini]MCM3764926.1 hypothetical protein [Neobacillus niacini]